MAPSAAVRAAAARLVKAAAAEAKAAATVANAAAAVHFTSFSHQRTIGAVQPALQPRLGMKSW